MFADEVTLAGVGGGFRWNPLRLFRGRGAQIDNAAGIKAGSIPEKTQRI